MLRRSDIYTIFTCVWPKLLMSRCNHSPPLTSFLSCCYQRWKSEAYATTRTAKSNKSIHLFATCTRMAVAFAIIVLSKQLKKFQRVNAMVLSFCCKWIHAPSRLICISLLDQPFYFGRFGRRFSNNTIKKGNLLFGNTIEMKYSSDRVFEAVQTPRCTTCFKDWLHRLSVTISRLLIGRDDMVPRKWRDGEAICFSQSHHPRNFRRNFKRNGHHKLSMLLPLVVPLEF